MKIHNQIIKDFLGEVNPSSRFTPRTGGAALNSNALLHYNTKKVVYSFNRVNNISPLLIKTEYLLKSVFRSMFSLISRPIYLIKHDKIIIRLFVYLSPKLDKYLDTSTTTSRFAAEQEGYSLDTPKNTSLLYPTLANAPNGRAAKQAVVAGLSSNVSGFKVRKFLRFKSFRPNAIEILKSQIHARNNYIAPTGGKRYPYTSLVSNFKNSLDKLCLIFEKIFNKKVEFEIIKAQLPFQDSNILAQILGYNANKYKFRQMLKILIPRAVIKNPSKEKLKFSTPTNDRCLASREDIITGVELKQAVTASLPQSHSISYLSGMNIKLAGRLMTQSMRPRFTVQSFQEGSLARVKIHFIEKSRFTGKNKRGAFSFTVSISHVFN